LSKAPPKLLICLTKNIHTLKHLNKTLLVQASCILTDANQF